MSKELTFATLGSVDAGKSTLIGTILSGKLDNGNGQNRKLVARFIHEESTGKTSSISTHSIKNFNKTDKSVIFVDLCGHQKYLKTTLFGVMGYCPDYAILVIGSNHGITKMTREHMKILYYLKVPMIIALTKTDIMEKVYESSDNKTDGLARITNNIRKIFAKKELNIIDINELIETNKSTDSVIPNSNTIPLIKLSCKTGYGLNYFKDYLSGLPTQINMIIPKPITNTPYNIFQVETVYCPPGIGWVLTGILKSSSEEGAITPDTTLYIGPGKFNNEYLQARVWSIRNYYDEKVDKLKCGQRGCLAVRIDKKITRNFFKKGTILTNNLDVIKKASYTFRAKIKLLNHPTNVKDNFTPVIHSGTIRQTAKITVISKELNSTNPIEKKDEPDSKCIYPGDTAIIEIKFLYGPEIVEPNQIFFLREGLTLGIGNFI
jgi:elongation factor 1-alpha